MNTGSFCYTFGFENHADPRVSRTAGAFTIALSGEFAAYMEEQLNVLLKKNLFLLKRETQNFSELLELTRGRHPLLPHFSRLDADTGGIYSFVIPIPRRGIDSEDIYLRKEISFLAFFVQYIDDLMTRYIVAMKKAAMPRYIEQPIRLYTPWERRLRDGFVARFSTDMKSKIKRIVVDAECLGKKAYGDAMITAANSILSMLPNKERANMTDAHLYAECLGVSIYGDNCRMLASAETGFRLVARNAVHPVQIAALLAATGRLSYLV